MNTDKSKPTFDDAPAGWTLTECAYQYDGRHRLTCEQKSVNSVDHPTIDEGPDWKDESVEENPPTTRIVRYKTDANGGVIMRREWEQNS